MKIGEALEILKKKEIYYRKDLSRDMWWFLEKTDRPWMNFWMMVEKDEVVRGCGNGIMIEKDFKEWLESL